jgi:hypothetical protein
MIQPEKLFEWCIGAKSALLNTSYQPRHAWAYMVYILHKSRLYRQLGKMSTKGLFGQFMWIMLESSWESPTYRDFPRAVAYLLLDIESLRCTPNCPNHLYESPYSPTPTNKVRPELRTPINRVQERLAVGPNENDRAHPKASMAIDNELIVPWLVSETGEAITHP